MHFLKGYKFLGGVADSLFLGFVFGGIVFSFKRRGEKATKVTFHFKPPRLSEALESLMADLDPIRTHGFDHREFDEHDLMFYAELQRSTTSNDRLVMRVSFHVGLGNTKPYKYEIPMSIKQMESIVRLFDDASEE